MITAGRRKFKVPKQKRESIKSWLKGYQSALSDGRMPEDGLSVTYNVVLGQNGTIKPSRSSVLYGVQPQGQVKGETFTFTRQIDNVTEFWECCLMEVSSVIKLYARKDGAPWVSYGDKIFSEGAQGRFDQTKQVVLIASTTDPLCWLDCSTMEVIVQTSLSTPAVPALSESGLTGANFTYRYRLTAVNVGESQASVAASIQTTIQRDIWDASTQHIDVQGTRVTGALGYQVYMGLTAGTEVYLGYIQDPGTGTTFTFRDNGTIATDASKSAPDFDSSELPALSHIKILDSRAFGWGDKDDQWKVWYGGIAESALKFAAIYGGGWTRVGNGTIYTPNGVTMFRIGKGDPAITVLSKAFAGRGKRFVMEEKTITEGNTIITFFDVREYNGEYGTDSPDAIVQAGDDIFYPSLGSFKKTGNKVDVPNILTSKGITDVIEKDVRALNPKAMDGAVGLFDEGRIYYALPYGSAESNNQLWSLDITRGGAWMRPIDIAVDWMWIYQDNDTGKKHFCYRSGAKIYEFTDSHATTRDGVGFDTDIGSGIMKFSDDGQEWSDVEKVVIVLIRPEGNLHASVVGKTEDTPLAAVGEQRFVQKGSVTGWTESAWAQLNWSELLNAPTEFGSQREELVIEVDEELQWLKYNFGSTGAGAKYEVSDVIIYHTPIGVKD